MGPLTTMLAQLQRQNQEDFARFKATHPGWGDDEVARALFNTRLNPRQGGLVGHGRLPGDNEGPISLGGIEDPRLLEARQTVWNPSITGRYRDPMQAGPSPPGGGGGDAESILFYPGRNVIEAPPQGQLAMMARRIR